MTIAKRLKVKTTTTYHVMETVIYRVWEKRFWHLVHVEKIAEQCPVRWYPELDLGIKRTFKRGKRHVYHGGNFPAIRIAVHREERKEKGRNTHTSSGIRKFAGGLFFLHMVLVQNMWRILCPTWTKMGAYQERTKTRIDALAMLSALMTWKIQ